MGTRRTFVHGSCVTRDGVETAWDQHGLELAGYTARQSVISVGDKAAEESFDTNSFPRPFLQKMARSDIRGSLLDTIRGTDRLDLVIWDLTDERNGVLQPTGGGTITNVIPWKSAGAFLGPGWLGRPILMGSAEHRALFEHAAGRFASGLSALGLLNKTIVNALPWATHDECGRPVENNGMSASEFNAYLSEYIDVLERYGFRAAITPQSEVVARSDHKWGRAPFHYVDETYVASLDAIESALVAY